MITCFHMDKNQKDTWIPRLFDLYYENMHIIAPSGLSYEVERCQWISEVSPALDKAPRQIILCLKGCDLVGYIQYYTRDTLLMIEEIQITPVYQGTLLFHRMCRYLYRNLPKHIEHLEAYANIRNKRSISIMTRLGFSETPDNACPGFIHLQADAAAVFRRLIHT